MLIGESAQPMRRMEQATRHVGLISFIVPAWDEESVLARTLEAIQASARTLPVPWEIIVADDASTDRTPDIARRHGARVVSVENRQISATRNAGAREARGDLFVFIDADTTVTEQAVRAAVKSVHGGAVGGGCAFRFDGPLPFYAKLLERAGVRIYRLLRIASGCFLFCTREAFEAVGGFDSRLYAAEEGAMSLALRRQGKFVILRESVVTSGRKLRTHSGREILVLMLRLLFRGRNSLRDRRGKEIWYGDRRPDPAGRGKRE
jgi:glycosyltransferase involved in cell wall biosynthesis